MKKCFLIVKRSLTHSQSPLSSSNQINWINGYDHKSVYSLFFQWILFEAAKSSSLVTLGKTLHETPIIKTITKQLSYPTLFKHFCGGSSLKDCLPVVQELHKTKIKTILDHSKEDLLDKKSLDENMDQKILLINEIRSSALSDQVDFLPLKCTSLLHPQALETLTTSILQHNDDYFTDTTWSFHQSILARLSSENKRLFEEGMLRMHRICQHAQENHLSLLLDAEQSHRQPAMDLIYHLLSLEYNKQRTAARLPVLFHTYQTYLTTTRQTLERDIQFSKRNNLSFGIKLVRGAYISSEKVYAKQTGKICPIWSTKSGTDACFSQCAHRLLDLIAGDDDHGVHVMFATHSRQSINEILQGMRERRCEGSSRVHFAQIRGMCDNLTTMLGLSGYQ
eukprot:gene6530-7203_t